MALTAHPAAATAMTTARRRAVVHQASTGHSSPVSDGEVPGSRAAAFYRCAGCCVAFFLSSSKSVAYETNHGSILCLLMLLLCFRCCCNDACYPKYSTTFCMRNPASPPSAIAASLPPTICFVKELTSIRTAQHEEERNNIAHLTRPQPFPPLTNSPARIATSLSNIPSTPASSAISPSMPILPFSPFFAVAFSASA